MAGAREFELLVFDWDGTLVDSIGRIVDCTLASLRDVGLPEVDPRDVRMSIGLGIRTMVERFVPGCDDPTFERICDAYRRHWTETYSRDPMLFDGAHEALIELQRDGYLLAVATAKSRWGLARDLEATGLESMFHSTRTADESRSKPDPAMLLQILDDLGVRAGSALMVGDTVHDLQMAANASVAGLGVTTGSHDRHELREVAALDVLDGVRQMPGWLRQRRAREVHP